MMYFIVLILLVAVIILIARGSGKGDNMNMMVSILHEMKRDITELKTEIRTLKVQSGENAAEIKAKMEHMAFRQGDTEAGEPYTNREKPTPAISAIIMLLPVPQEPLAPVFMPPAAIIEEAEPVQPVADLPGTVTSEEVSTEAPEYLSELNTAAYSSPPRQEAPLPYQQQESWFDKWLSNNTDLEKFIGENLINKIGIAILVLGIAFFVKYAIDKEWINEIGRVGIGMGCGAILIGLAHFLRNSYRSFSSVLAGGAISVFYFTIAFAFHQYHLLPQAAAFVVMVVITAFAIALSVLYDKLELAVIAVLGGFITPFLVSTGDGNYIVLFTYLIVLNIGMLALAYFKRWPVINIISLFFTEIIYGGWLSTVIGNPTKHFSYPLALLFATAFYFIFLGMNMLNQLKNKEYFKVFDFFILLFISSTYYGAGMLLLHNYHAGTYTGIFTLGMAMVNLALAYIVYKNGKADRNLLFLLIGITLTFITLTIPVQLHGHAITLFWSAEFVLLYWLAGYSGIRLFRQSSGIVCLLSVVSLFIDWQKAADASTGHLFVIYNNLQGIVTNVVSIAAFTAYYFLIRRDAPEEVGGVSNEAARRVALAMAIGLFFLTCICGVNLYYNQLSSYMLPNVFHQLITALFALVFIYIAGRDREKFNPWTQIAAFAIVFIFFLGSSVVVANLRYSVLNFSQPWSLFIFHWLNDALFIALVLMVINTIRKNTDFFSDSVKAMTVIMTAVILIFLSVEFQHIYIIAAYHKDNSEALTLQYSKAGLTVIWALSSFAMMWLGMKHRQKILRIISLVLFSIVLLKLFIFDISGISEGGKILAFILLGVLLLTVSFMYQKLKKIIIDDKNE
ncbi:MAG: DUF2339 domain-containing protein [Taibaiella sp.]|nr:DUF2339 domain-containing protein [Taibaiella sp.]